MNYRKNIDDAYNIVNISKSDIPNITRVILQIYDNFEITTSDNFLKLGSGWYAYAYLLKKFNVVAKIYKDKHLCNDADKQIIKNYQKIKNAVDCHICPNFIYFYDFIDNPFCLLLEYADGSLKGFLESFSEFDLNFDILESIVIQLLVGILCMQKKINMFHNSLDLENIFYKKIHSETTLYYNINGVLYEIKTYGILVMIADVDSCITHNNIKYNKEFKKIDLVTQHNRIIKLQLKKLYEAYGIPKTTKSSDMRKPDIYRNLVTRNLITASVYENARRIYYKESKKSDGILSMMSYIINNINEEKMREFIPDKLYSTYKVYKMLTDTIFTNSVAVPIEQILRDNFSKYIKNITDIPDIDTNPHKYMFTMEFSDRLEGGMSTNNYYLKYLKYKTKYLNLKT
jgi:hypothetical protein